MIIGVTGNYASGKDTVAEILQEMNFYHVSFSDILRERLKEQGTEITRDNLIVGGNDLRNKHGANILAKLALERIKDGENYVFTSIRNPSEVEHLQKRKDFILVNVTANEEIRLSRILARGRIGEKEPNTIGGLREKEARENIDGPHNQQLNKVGEMAQVNLSNEHTLEELKEKTERLVKENLFKLQDSRPDWDHYFMNIAEQVKMRCNCMSAKKGAIIVKDKMIVSAGYNGTPKKVKHCTDGGCQRCTSRHLGRIKSGVYSEPCICAHAEENAIAQAAYQGTSTKRAKLYTTFTPCTNCVKLIINAGITEVIAKVKYPDDTGTKLLAEAGINLRILD